MRILTLSTGRARVALTAIVGALLLVSAFPILLAAPAQADVTTYGQDNLRTGWYADQTTLSPGLVSGGTFGQMWNSAITGQAYAQPLVFQGTVIVATESNDIYGLNATSGAQQWHRNVGTPFNPNDVGCSDLLPTIGVTGTPVIDPATSTAYFLKKTYNSGASGPAAYYAHAVDVATGAERSGFPVKIQGSDGSATNPRTFDATKELQRPGLLLLNGVVYAGFGGHCDRADYTGWVVGISTAGSITALWNAEAGEAGNPGAGIWQSGGGLVSDGPNTIVLSTGNGNIPTTAAPGNAPPKQLGEAVVRLTVQADKSLKATDFFMPYDADVLDSWDGDVGSGAPVVLPSSSFGTASVPHVSLQIGKQGYLYVMNADDLGGYKQGPSASDKIVQRLGPFGGVWSKPAAWGGDGGYVYLTTASGGGQGGGSNGYMRALKYGVDGNGKPTFTLAGSSSDTFGFSSSSPVITSSGTTSGSALVWVIWSPDGSGANAQLRAYDPIPVNGTMQLRWSSPIGTASKFAVPSISGNRVFVGTRDGHLISFGSPVTTPLSGPSTSFPVTTVGQSTVRQVALTANFDLDITAMSTTNAVFTAGTPSPPLPVHLAKNATITVPVTFSPTAAALSSASLSVTTSSGPVSFSLSGSGQNASAQITANPASVSLGGAAIGGTPITGSVTFHNSGAQSLTISSASPPAAPFSVSGLPAVGSAIAPGADVVATITFTPSAAGLFTDKIDLVTTGGTISVPMSATATTPPQLTLSTTALSFGSVVVNAEKSISFTVTNTGGGPLSITKSKPPTGGIFTATTTITEGTTIAAGASVAAVVRFSPSVAGAASASWDLNGNDGLGVRTLTMSGTGVATPPIGPPPAGGWQLNGSASLSGSTLILTPNAANQAGSAYWPYPIKTQDLKLSFDETIDQGNGADGMALVFADPTAGALPTSLGGTGGALGYAGTAGVAVTFDTYTNGNDPGGNFMGIATSGVGDVLTYAATNTTVPALRNATHHVDVLYTGGILNVKLDNAQVFNQAVALPANAYLGWSAGTGGSTDRHSVTNTTFDRLVAGSLTVSPTPLAFGPVTTGNTLTKSFTITNPGQTPVTLLASTSPGAPFSAPAPIANGTVLNPGASVTKSVTFSPAGLGAKAGSYSLTGSDGTTATLSLTGISQPIVWSPGIGGWTLNGTARRAYADFELTPATASQAGSMYWPTPVDSSFVQVTFDATLGGGTGGNGLAVSFADATKNQPTALGGTAGGLGWVGTPGFMAALDTNKNNNEPSANFVGFASSWGYGAPNYNAVNASVPVLRNQTRHVVVTVTGSHVVMAIDGVVVLDSIQKVPGKVLVGVTAATGYLFDRQAIKNVGVLTQPPP